MEFEYLAVLVVFCFKICCCPSFDCANKWSISTYVSIMAGTPGLLSPNPWRISTWADPLIFIFYCIFSITIYPPDALLHFHPPISSNVCCFYRVIVYNREQDNLHCTWYYQIQWRFWCKIWRYINQFSWGYSYFEAKIISFGYCIKRQAMIGNESVLLPYSWVISPGMTIILICIHKQSFITINNRMISCLMQVYGVTKDIFSSELDIQI